MAGKGNTPAAVETNSDILKFTKKVEAGAQNYEDLNETVKRRVVEAKIDHDDKMDELLLIVTVAQVEISSLAKWSLQV